MTNELTVRDDNLFIAPVANVNTALSAYQAMKEFVGGVLKEDVDFGKVPGTDKNTLLKPGSEKLLRFFGMFVKLQELERCEDWTGKDHNGEPFFYYRYKAIATRNGEAVAEAVGSCSSWEKKYRYRNSNLVCPSCGSEAIIKGKVEYGGGWLCYKKNGGCGAKFGDNDKKITDQPRGKIANPDIADIVNTIDKMAQKRAIVGVSLLACNASDYFTQDIEDYTDTEWKPVITNQSPPVEDGHFEEVEQPEPTPTTMTLETAEAVQNSEGECYGDIETKTLSHMANSITKAMKKEGLPDDKLAEYQLKLDAIKIILASRSE